MRKCFWFIVGVFFLFILTHKNVALAFTPASDPQYVVVNFADKFYFADWGAPEDKWQKEVKPELEKDLIEMRNRLGSGTDQRKLAWSTLLEYTDMPMDTPSENSRYVVQARRIMEMADDLNFPVFMPLNGYQWWNEVPELWNWWDDDGNKTPGCTNAEYTQIERYAGTDPVYKCKFPKLRDPAYRERFIKGYNPDNKWNVEWQNWTTPMKLNWRNWGAGGFQLAPPPDLVENHRTAMSYHEFQQQRFDAITKEISKTLDKWQQEGKQDLFAGLTIGTEVSLNASVTKQDEFVPYGYRAIQDEICPQDQPMCGSDYAKEHNWTKTDLDIARGGAVGEYLSNLAIMATKNGIPKQRIYSHVWSEAQYGEPRYDDYFTPSVNLYARPGLSLYGFAQKPAQLDSLRNSIFDSEYSYPHWGAVEFSTDKTAPAWSHALQNTMDNPINPAMVIDVYNWKEHKDTPAEAQIKQFLSKRPASRPLVSEIIPDGDQVQFNPTKLTWHLLDDHDEADHQEIAIFKHRPIALNESPDKTITVDPATFEWQVSDLKPGVYFWYVKRSASNGKTVATTSEPRVFTVPVVVPEPTNNWFHF